MKSGYKWQGSSNVTLQRFFEMSCPVLPVWWLSTSGPENQPTSTINQGDPGRCGVALRQIERDIIFELVVAPPKKCVAPPKNVSVGDYPSSMYGIIVNNRFMDIYGIILNNLIHIYRSVFRNKHFQAPTRLKIHILNGWLGPTSRPAQDAQLKPRIACYQYFPGFYLK